MRPVGHVADYVKERNLEHSRTMSEVYEHYLSWCDRQEPRVEPDSLPVFAAAMRKLGVQAQKINGRMRYLGVTLRTGGGAE